MLKCSAERNVINPFLHNLKISQITCVFSFMTLILSSLSILYVVFRYHRSTLKVYLSVVYYCFCQLQLLSLTTLFWIIESSFTSGKCWDFLSYCQIKQPIQTVSLILPGYAVLIITIIRMVQILKPLRYFVYIRYRYQVAAMGLSWFITTCVVLTPITLQCDSSVQVTRTLRYCTYQPIVQGACHVFYSVLVILGFCIPVISVMVMYGYIYKVSVKSRGMILPSTTAKRSPKPPPPPPWSILAILTLHSLTSAPWIIMITLTTQLITLIHDHVLGYVVFDVVYAGVQVLTGCTTLVYLATTNSLRRYAVRDLGRAWRGLINTIKMRLAV